MPGAMQPVRVGLELRDVSALRRGVERVDRLAARHEQAVAVLPDEAEVRGAFGHQDLADPRAIRSVDVDPVDALAAEPGAAPEISVDVSPDAVVKAGIQRRELPAVGEAGAVVLDRPRD